MDNVNSADVTRVDWCSCVQSSSNYEIMSLTDSVVIGVVPYTQYKVTIIAKPISGGYWSQPSATYEFVTISSCKYFCDTWACEYMYLKQ